VAEELSRAGARDLSYAIAEATEAGHTQMVLQLLTWARQKSSPMLWLNNLNTLLIGAASQGNIDLVNQALQLGATPLDEALAEAARHGQLNMIDYLIQRGAHYLDRAFASAARHNQINAMYHLRKAGANDLDRALLAAANYGQLEAVKLLLEWGAMEIRGAVWWVISSSNPAVVDYLKSLLPKTSDGQVLKLNG
jgi:ankyrin repeat protein